MIYGRKNFSVAGTLLVTSVTSLNDLHALPAGGIFSCTA